ncbi:zinc finger CCHC-type and RNA-binding motif-containing protein 1-like [Ptychodera flava]|uniref:zinc finger CCHC-type and RNA-binding motif-containing protein 1-like n=1 Tax=Ptychodera flava TaxID=63121 RepID=UPI00396A05AA
MSGGLAPSKSTIYVSNLPFSLTNNDLHKIFAKYGTVVKVTIMKDKETRRSKGVAFVLYLKREEAYKAIKALNNKELFGRRLTCKIATDNGRASDFIRRRDYPDKSRCYECGEVGHLSYKCPKNALGEREQPKKKKKKDKRNQDESYSNQMAREEEEEEEEAEEEEEFQGEDPALESLSAAIQYQRERMEEEEYRYRVATGNYESENPSTSEDAKKLKIKKDAYFSDEEAISDDD